MHAEKGIAEPSLDSNLIIHGDNLHALKAILPLYAGKVDCIVIDPPYNTGNEGWCYNDNVNAPMIREWIDANPVGTDDGLRHDKWCAMMWPRLRLLHELLSETGSFWMTLDDNEVHRARGMLDEIFGSRRSLGQIAWQKRTSRESGWRRCIVLHYLRASIMCWSIRRHIETLGNCIVISCRRIMLATRIPTTIPVVYGRLYRFLPKDIAETKYMIS